MSASKICSYSQVCFTMTSKIKELFPSDRLKCIYGTGEIDQLLSAQTNFIKGPWFNFQHLHGGYQPVQGGSNASLMASAGNACTWYTHT